MSGTNDVQNTSVVVKVARPVRLERMKVVYFRCAFFSAKVEGLVWRETTANSIHGADQAGF